MVNDPPPGRLDCAGKLLDLSFPRVMGVLNVTPDSFSDGGAYHADGLLSLDRTLYRVEQMLDEGADIVDVGGESTRPGAERVSTDEEAERVLPVVEAVTARFDTIVSVDTSTPSLMRDAARVGAGLINDVRALQRDGALQAVADTGLPVCLMHMQGDPGSMQRDPRYGDVVADVADFLQARADACRDAGIAAQQIVLDPGFGFGKTPEHNLTLLNRLQELRKLGYPLLAGLSRKSLIGRITGRALEQRLAGSVAMAALAVIKGASIIRAHDVAGTVDAVKVADATLRESIND